jgi:outer membrane protein assembly factor BamB
MRRVARVLLACAIAASALTGFTARSGGATTTSTPFWGGVTVAPGPQPGEYALTWARAAVPNNYVIDVDVKYSSDPTWTSLFSGATDTSGMFAPSAPGPYSLRGRLRNLTTDEAANWSPTVTLAGDWPMFDFDAQHPGVTQDPTIGASNAADLTVEWKSLATPFHDFVASPAVALNSTLNEPVVYTATVSGVIAARDLATGTTLWSRPGNGPIEASPAVFGNTVYVGTEKHRLLALDAATGALQCQFALSGAVISSPVVGSVDATGPVVFFGDTGRSEADNAGHEWAVNDVGNTAGSCTRKWVFNAWHEKGPKASRTGSWSPPALTTDSGGRSLLILGSADPDDSVYALNARNGKQVWRFQTKVTTPDDDVGAAPSIGTPGVNGFGRGVVYINGKDKIEYAIDLVNGAKIWQVDLKKAAGGADANAQSAAALVGNRVIVPYDRYVFAFDATTGAQVWRSAPGAGDYYASPAVSGAPGDQVVLIGDAGGVEHGYRLTDGAQLLRVDTGGAIFSSAALAFGDVLFGSDDGYLYAVG